MPSRPNARKQRPKAQPARPARPVAEESVIATTPTATPAPTISGSLLSHLADTPHVRQVLAMSPGGRLSGATTSDRWLPQDLAPELDDARQEHLRIRARVVEAIVARADLRAGYKREDAEHAEALRQAYRVGGRQPEDTRTSEADRETAIARAEERLWAGVDVLGEQVEEVVNLIREHENEWLGAVRTRLRGLEQERHDAQLRIDAVAGEEWKLHRTGQWILTSSDDGILGRQPAPEPCAPPPDFDRGLLATSTTRSWLNPAPERVGAVSELADPTTTAKARRDEMPNVDEMVDDPDEVNMLISSREGAAA